MPLHTSSYRRKDQGVSLMCVSCSCASRRFASKETSGETPIKFVAIRWNVSVPIRSFNCKSRGIVKECNCTAMNLID